MAAGQIRRPRKSTIPTAVEDWTPAGTVAGTRTAGGPGLCNSPESIRPRRPDQHILSLPGLFLVDAPQLIFAEAVLGENDSALGRARDALAAALSPAAPVDAVSVVGLFN